jgi:ADP-ribosylglycohydrolase
VIIIDIMEERVKKALISLKGTSIGDALGESFFGSTGTVLNRIEKRILPSATCSYTDDTQMAISIVECLIQYGCIKQDRLAELFAGRMEYKRGYGMNTRIILEEIRRGGDWRHLSRFSFKGKGSFGNGAAMRAAPLGAYFYKNKDKVIENAVLSAEVTHSHREGIAGAVAVALAACFTANLKKGKNYRYQDLFEYILDNLKDSRVKNGIERARDLGDINSFQAAGLLGSGQYVSARDTVPYVIWCASKYLLDFEEAFWATVNGLGDRDTTCAMVCGITALKSTIPEKWLKIVEKLPEEFEILSGEPNTP